MVLSQKHNEESLGPDAIHISNIPNLILYRGYKTSNRRVPAVYQLTCIRKNCPWYYNQPKEIKCENRGTDGVTTNWKCTGKLRTGYEFGTLNVQCEGYRYKDDEWVLKDSCALEYEIVKTPRQPLGWAGVLVICIFVLVGFFCGNSKTGRSNSRRSSRRTTTRSGFARTSSR